MKKITNFLKNSPNLQPKLLLVVIAVLCGSIVTIVLMAQNRVGSLTNLSTSLEEQLAQVGQDLNDLKSQDQYIINQNLAATISAVESTYQQSVEIYEDLLTLQDQSDDTADLEKLFAQTLTYLSELNYASASATLDTMSAGIQAEFNRIATEFVIPQAAVADNNPPGAGFRQQRVSTGIGDYLVSIITVDLNSARAIVDTASDSDCTNDCPVLSLGEYAGRSGAFAGINGSYFCPASYPSCAGKTNTFDTLAMNKNKHYFNSDNNVYSTVPAVIFSGNSARFVGQSLEWGRDTGVDAVLANQPMLVSGGNVVFGGDGDPKKGSKAGRSFVGATGSTAYIGVVHSATVAESAVAVQAMGIQYAINLDSGGSTALWYNGYKVGPGRNLPNVLLFVNK